MEVRMYAQPKNKNKHLIYLFIIKEELSPDLLYVQGPWGSYQVLCLCAEILWNARTLFLWSLTGKGRWMRQETTSHGREEISKHLIIAETDMQIKGERNYCRKWCLPFDQPTSRLSSARTSSHNIQRDLRDLVPVNQGQAHSPPRLYQTIW